MRRSSRRGVLTAGVVTLSTTLAGCGDIPFLGASIPSLDSGWLVVEESGDAKFAFQFNDDIESIIERAPVSKSDVVSVAAENDVELAFESVDIAGVDGPEERQIEGRLRNFAEKKSWPSGTWYSTPRVTYEESLPEEGRAPLSVRFPDGGGFELPMAYERAGRFADGGDPELFDYDGGPPERTFPYIQYYAHEDLTEIRLAAEYRFNVIKRLYKFYDIGWYQERAMDDIRAGVNEIIGELGREGLGSIVTSPLPTVATAPADVVSTAETLEGDLPELESSLDTLERGLNASVNETWMADLRGDGDDRRGLGDLGQFANREWSHDNPKLATSNDTDRFTAAFEEYRTIVSDQRAITRRLLSPDSVFRTTSPFGGEYWTSLYTLARDLLREFDQQLAVADEVLTDIRESVG